jgi:hypothetical protein
MTRQLEIQALCAGRVAAPGGLVTAVMCTRYQLYDVGSTMQLDATETLHRVTSMQGCDDTVRCRLYGTAKPSNVKESVSKCAQSRDLEYSSDFITAVKTRL